MTKTPRKRGRPSIYSEALAERICHEIAQGKLLRRICRLPGMPAESTVHKWAVEREDFSESLARARMQGTEANLEEAEDKLRQATGKNIAVVRELAFHLRWKASKLKPRQYGDRVQHGFDDGVTLRLEFGRRSIDVTPKPDAIPGQNGESLRPPAEGEPASVVRLPTNQPHKVAAGGA